MICTLFCDHKRAHVRPFLWMYARECMRVCMGVRTYAHTCVLLVTHTSYLPPNFKQHAVASQLEYRACGATVQKTWASMCLGVILGCLVIGHEHHSTIICAWERPRSMCLWSSASVWKQMFGNSMPQQHALMNWSLGTTL
jgi:hypothetical protein